MDTQKISTEKEEKAEVKFQVFMRYLLYIYTLTNFVLNCYKKQNDDDDYDGGK